jgi:hypothetical protein
VTTDKPLTVQQEYQKRILTMQRDLMTAIMQYQITFGAGSVGWNVTVNFSKAPENKS